MELLFTQMTAMLMNSSMQTKRNLLWTFALVTGLFFLWDFVPVAGKTSPVTGNIQIGCIVPLLCFIFGLKGHEIMKPANHVA